MKRLKLILVMILTFSVTGCINEYDLTEEQSDAVAEYAAGILLINDDMYDQKLIPMDEYETDFDTGFDFSDDSSTSLPDDAGSSEDAENDEGNASDSKNKYTLSEVIGNNNLDIRYKEYMLTPSYPKTPESDAFSLDARTGYQLLVMSFDVTNTTNKDQRLDLSDAGINYQLDVNAGTIYKPELTFQENDLRFIDITVKSKKTIQALLIFEVNKNEEISGMNLLASKGSKSEIIKIK